MGDADSVVWKGSGLQCLKCNQKVEARDGNLELAVNLHLESHRNRETGRSFQDTTPGKTQLDSTYESSLLRSSPGKTQEDYSYRCPVCKENVEIKYNDVKLSLQVHSMKHQGAPDKRPDDQLSNFSGKSKTSSKKNNKEAQPAADTLSNSGSNKSKQSKKNNKEHNQSTVQRTELTILDDIFNAMSLGLKAHRGFMQRNVDGKTNCQVCNMAIENTFSISEHLKTKSHEDNAIRFLKTFVSKDLLSEFDFVSFYGSNLCCNLCKCQIHMCSKNPHETIVNIMNHNAQKTHLKSNSSPSHQFDDINAVLLSLSQKHLIVNENKDYITVKMQPQISCNLCNKQITCGGDRSNLFPHLNSHFLNAKHVKYKHAASVLYIFDKLNIPGKENHMFTPGKGSVNCSVCACSVEANLKKLEEHVKAGSSAQSEGLSFPKKTDGDNLSQNSTVQQLGNREEFSVKRLLSTMPAQYRNVDYIMPDDKGQVTCLVCSCTIPATSYNLLTHLTGNKHKKSEEDRQTEQILSSVTPADSSGLDSSQVSKIIDKFFNTLIVKDPVLAGHEAILVKYRDGQHYCCNICGELIPSSQDLNNFRTSLYNHVQSQSHKIAFSQRGHSDSVNNFQKGINVYSLQELFKALPASLQSEQQFIKIPHNESHLLFCTACKIKVPAYSLQAHLEGGSHTESVKKHESALIRKFSGMSLDNNSLLNQLMTTDKTIKLNAKFIAKKGEDYLCTLCQATIKQSYELQILKDNFLSHFTGQKHSKSSDKVVSDIVDKLLVSNPVIKAEKSHLKVGNKTVHCTLCDVAMPSGVEEGPLTRNIVSHFAGSKHQAKKNSQFLTKPLTSRPIKPSHPTSDPFLAKSSSLLGDPTNYQRPWPDSNSFMGDHSSYPQPPNYPQPPTYHQPPNYHQPVAPYMPSNPGMGDRSTYNYPHPHPQPYTPPYQPVPPQPPLHQPNAPLSNYANRSSIEHVNSFDLVSDSFKSIPGNLQDQIKFIKIGSIEGYLTCTLCNSTINPYFLKDHLLERQHVFKKNELEKKPWQKKRRQNM